MPSPIEHRLQDPQQRWHGLVVAKAFDQPGAPTIGLFELLICRGRDAVVLFVDFALMFRMIQVI